MFERRYEVQGDLAVLSALHVGSGEVEVIKGVGGREGSNEEPPGVARIVRDHAGQPYLPPTTLKGLLRRIGEEILSDEAVSDLFGVIKDSGDGSGVMGAILARGATLDRAGDATNYPYAVAAGALLGAGVFVAARTAVDPLAGVADDHKLFFQETVAPGAVFKLSLLLISRKDKPERIESLKAILAVLAAKNGVAVGRGKADGAGALLLRRESLNIVERTIGDDGKLTKTPVNFVLPEPRRERRTPLPWRGTFICKGPFLSVDSSHDPNAGRKDGDDKGAPQLVYQRGAKLQPLELGSQVAGVLRARARWIMGLKALKAGLDPRSVDPGAGADKDTNARTVRARSDVIALDLTPVERLFGVAGFAGLLRIEKLHFSDGTPIEISSVKLDHFSGAPIDKALFATRAMTGVRLELALVLQDRGGVGTPTPDDKELFDALLGDMEEAGLTLGHGVNKGFGWFQFEKGVRDAK